MEMGIDLEARQLLRDLLLQLQYERGEGDKPYKSSMKEVSERANSLAYNAIKKLESNIEPKVPDKDWRDAFIEFQHILANNPNLSKDDYDFQINSISELGVPTILLTYCKSPFFLKAISELCIKHGDGWITQRGVYFTSNATYQEAKEFIKEYIEKYDGGTP